MGTRVPAALAELDTLVKRRGLLSVVREIEDAAGRTIDPCSATPTCARTSYPGADAQQLTLLVQWGALPPPSLRTSRRRRSELRTTPAARGGAAQRRRVGVRRSDRAQVEWRAHPA